MTTDESARQVASGNLETLIHAHHSEPGYTATVPDKTRVSFRQLKVQAKDPEKDLIVLRLEDGTVRVYLPTDYKKLEAYLGPAPGEAKRTGKPSGLA